MNDRRTPTPIKVIHERPPNKPGNLRTVNANDMEDHEIEPWLEKMGYHTGYIYMNGDDRRLAYFESDKL